MGLQSRLAQRRRIRLIETLLYALTLSALFIRIGRLVWTDPLWERHKHMQLSLSSLFARTYNARY